MDSFQYVYGGGQFAGANPIVSTPMQHAGIPSMQQQQQQQQQGAFMQHMDASADQHIQQQLFHHQHQQLPMMAQYTHDPFTANRSSPVPQQQQQQMGSAMQNTYAPRIINDPESAIFYHDARSNSLVDHNARQMVSADGAVFIEHLAGYSVVFVPNSLPIDSAICDIASALRPSQAGGARAGSAGSEGNKRAAAAALRKPHVTKPSNPFIMYRNFKIREMRIQNPAINQTDISREAGKWWKEETDEVKEMFRAKYREEKQAYDVLKSKRARGNTEAARLGGGVLGSDEGDDMYGPATKKRKMSAGLGLSDRPGSAIAKPRSRTMPSNAYGASNARLSVATDLRKHLAAKHHYESSGNAFIDGSSPFDHHQHHEFHNPYAGMSATTVNNSPMASIADPYVDGAMPPISLDAVQVFQSVSMPQHPADYQDHAAYLYQQQENPLVSMPSIINSTSLAPEGYANIAAVAADMGISSSSVAAVAAAAASVVAVEASAAPVPDVPSIVTTGGEHHQHWGALSDYVDPSAAPASADNASSPDDALDNSAITTVGGYSPNSDKEETYKLPSIAELSGSTPADTSSAEAVTASEIPTSTPAATAAATAV